MADVIGLAVATAGSIGGTMAGQKLFNGTGDPGGGIPGLTTSNNNNKNQNMNVTQVDPSIALDYFSQASQAQAAGYDKGLAMYKPALDKAVTYINSGYSSANSTLKPLSTASGEALNEQLRYLGLDPIQKTAGYGDAIRTVGSAFDPSSDIGKYAVSLADKLDSAAGIKDPAQRAAAKQDLLTQFDSAKAMINNPIQAKIDAIKIPQALTVEQYRSGLNQQAIAAGVRMDPEQMLADAEAGVANRQAGINALTKKKTDLQNQLKANDGVLSSLDGFKNQFANSYGDQYDAPYTGDQIADKITNTPGYQFQLEQGQQALERSASSQGMLHSANTQLAVQEFGQQQANSYFQNQMNSLGQVIAQGTPATMQISANQASQGGMLAQIAQLYGTAAMDTERAKADFVGQQLMASGNLFNQTAEFNAGLQFQGQQGELNRQADQAKASTAAGPGYLNAVNKQGMLDLAQQQFNQQVANSRSSAAGYLRGIMG